MDKGYFVRITFERTAEIELLPVVYPFFANTSKFIKIHTYKVEVVGDTFNGAEIVRITTQQLQEAGYDLTDISGLTLVYRDAPAQTSGWLNLLNLFLFDFKVY